jgi:hypothetical protein
MAVFAGIGIAAVTWLGWNFYEYQQDVNGIYDEFAESIDRIESDLKAQGREEDLKLFQQEAIKRIEKNEKLRAAVERMDHLVPK